MANQTEDYKSKLVLRRYSLFPLRSDEHRIFELYREQENNSWSVGEVNISDDIIQYEHLTPVEQRLFKRLIAFFNVGDRPVISSLAKIEDYVDPNDLVRLLFLGSQNRIEGVHIHMYGLFGTEIISDPLQREKLYDAVNNFPSIKAKIEVIEKYQKPGADKRLLILSQACAEGIGFSTAFAGALYFKTIGRMLGFCYANTKIMQDESIHYRHMCEWLCELEALTDEDFYAVVQDFVRVEELFAKDLFDELDDTNNKEKKNLGLLSAESLFNYAKYISDLLCQYCNKTPLYNIEQNPLPYMDVTALKGKANFFERTVSEYKQISIQEASQQIKLDFNRII